MKNLIIGTLLALTSTSAFASQGKGSCKGFAEKVAMNLFSVESTLYSYNDITAEIQLRNTATGSDRTQWTVSFLSSAQEWYTAYTIETVNYGDAKAESCALEVVTVERAG